MTQREAFEAWAKSQNLDPDHKERDAWGRDVYSPHIHSMWCGWQAAQAQATAEPVAFLETITGQVRLPDDEHRVRFPKAYEPLYKTTQVAPGDIRALKHRIHELEGEVIGYKRILDGQAAQAAAPAEHQAFTFRMKVLEWNRAQVEPPIAVTKELWVAGEIFKLLSPQAWGGETPPHQAAVEGVLKIEEPVAWQRINDYGYGDCSTLKPPSHTIKNYRPLYTSPPTAFMDGYEGGKQEARDAAHAEIDRLGETIGRIDVDRERMRGTMRLALETLREATSYTSCPSWSPSMTDECNAAIAALEGIV